MGEFGFKPEEIARLIRLVETRGLSKLVYQEEGRRIVIRGAVAPPTRPNSASPSVTAQNGATEAARLAVAPLTSEKALRQVGEETAARPSLSEDCIVIEAPMVGVFYRSAQPGAPPLVEVGDHVEVGQTIGLIEAMKVFSEIPAEVAGTVVKITDKNGQLVRQGEPLIYLKPE